MYWLSVLSILTAVSFGLAIPAVSLWEDIRVKHTWATTPEEWDCLGHPPAGTTIDLHIALKSHQEDALVNALYKVSNPKASEVSNLRSWQSLSCDEDVRNEGVADNLLQLEFHTNYVSNPEKRCRRSRDGHYPRAACCALSHRQALCSRVTGSLNTSVARQCTPEGHPLTGWVMGEEVDRGRCTDSAGSWSDDDDDDISGCNSDANTGGV
ncbi:hypothetical protein BGW80DRAFT_1259023 [Lactifluus volemus]|nr:hypothetical protein BGW80DRAFT_1259023 [Lactifluus volemus]